MTYDVVIVPSLRTMRSSTLKFLEHFSKNGGVVIFAGEIPSLVDAVPHEGPRLLADRSARIPFTKRAVMDALQPVREIEALAPDGSRCQTLLHQWRQEGGKRFLFLSNSDRDQGLQTRLALKGRWNAFHLDTLTGDRQELPVHHENDWTRLEWTFSAHGHLLLALDPATTTRTRRAVSPASEPAWSDISVLSGPVPITLSEPNVLLLDQAEFRLNDGAWRGSEEILRLDNILRRELNLPPQSGAIAQPWADVEPSPILAKLELKFTIEAGVPVAAPQLALEDDAEIELFLNGKLLSGAERKPVGYYVDESILSLIHI